MRGEWDGGLRPFMTGPSGARCALLRCGVLGINSCARPRSTEPAALLLWIQIRIECSK
jgi:hypothetical protein